MIDISEDSRSDREREILVRLASRLAGAATSSEVMGALSEESDRLLTWDACYLAHYELGNERIRIAYHVDMQDGRKIILPGEELGPEEIGPVLARALAGEALIFNRKPGAPGPPTEPVGTGRLAASLMFVPIRARDKIIAAFSAQSYTPDRYNETDLKLLQEIANTVGPAIERMHAEDALRVSEARYRLLVERIPAITYTETLVATGSTAYISPQILGLLGCSPEEYSTFRDLLRSRLHPDDREAALAALAHGAEQGEPFVSEYRLLARDGRALWFRDVATVARDGEGRPLCLHGVVTDITERRQAEDLVRLQRDIALALSSTSSVAGALDGLLAATFRVDGIDCGAVYFVDEAAGDVNLVAHRQLSADFVARVARMPADSWQTRQAMAGEPLYFSLQELSRGAEWICLAESIHSLAVIPIRAEARAIAILILGSRNRDEIPAGARHALEATAAQLGGAILRIRAEAGLRQAHDELEARVRERTLQLRRANEELTQEIARRTAAEAQRETLAQAVENAAEGIGIWTADWLPAYTNAAMLRLLQVQSLADIGKDPWGSFLEAQGSAPRDWIDAELTKERRWDGRLRVRRADGTGIPVVAAFSRFVAADGSILTVGNFRDTSEEEEYLTQIRKLTTGAQKNLEEERARISRELHDELGQSITALNMQLVSLRRRTSELEPPVRDLVAEMMSVTGRILESVRDLAKSLRPPLLGPRGLIDALRSYAAEFERRSHIKCRVRVDPAELLPAEPLTTTAFRIIQEALTNVARHSRAGNCDVSLVLKRGVLEVKIRDDGVGATRSELSGRRSLGVVGMRERAAAAGGSVRFESAPGEGVCVTARLPMKTAKQGKRP